jgi:membrane dipeptidase
VSEAAVYPFFDAHCDTVMKVLDDGADFIGGDQCEHVSWPGMVAADVRAQVFACFVLSERHPGEEARRANRMIDALESMVADTDGEMRLVRTGTELERAFGEGPRAAILGLEGADPLEGSAENLRAFVERGVRDLIFAWKDNPFSGTAFGENTPLTAEGERLLGLCEELRVMVDVSHLSDSAFDDVCRAATRPFIASHSNCRALCPSPRNLPDEMICALAERGGVMGINLSPAFLNPGFYHATLPLFEASQRPDISQEELQGLREQASEISRGGLEWMVRHVVHAIDVGGEDCIGLGGDLDGIPYLPEGMNGVEDLPRFVPILRDAGLSEAQIEKVCHRNFVRVFSEVLGAS